MSETRSKRDTLGAEVWNNTPLRTLYSLGFAVIGIGIVVAIVAASIQATAYDAPDGGAYAWLFFGIALIVFGVLAIIGGLIAHAVNWQIVNR